MLFVRHKKMEDQEMKTKQAFATLVLIIFFILCCLQEGSAYDPDWKTTHNHWSLKCKVNVTGGGRMIGWSQFIVNYSISKPITKYESYNELITYKCSNKLFNPSSFNCEWVTDWETCNFSGFSPKRSLEIDLKLGTLDAREKICKRIFNKCKDYKD